MRTAAGTDPENAAFCRISNFDAQGVLRLVQALFLSAQADGRAHISDDEIYEVSGQPFEAMTRQEKLAALQAPRPIQITSERLTNRSGSI